MYGPDHPEVAKYFGHLGDALKGQVRSARFRQHLARPRVPTIIVIIVDIAGSKFVEAKQRWKRVRDEDTEGAGFKARGCCPTPQQENVEH